MLTGGIAPTTEQSKKGKKRARSEDEDDSSEAGPSTTTAALPAAKKHAPNHKVRTSQSDRTLDSMFPVLPPSQRPSIEEAEPGQTQQAPPVKVPEIAVSECILASVLRLREEVERVKHEGRFLTLGGCKLLCLCWATELTEILQKHVFVGVVDLERCLSLIQHSKKLYLVNHGASA